MSILKSDKAMLGAGLMFLILNVAILAPIATGAVPDAVAEATAEAPKDDICSNDDCTEIEADWASSSTDRDFYGWNLTNLGEVMMAAHQFMTKLGRSPIPLLLIAMSWNTIPPLANSPITRTPPMRARLTQSFLVMSKSLNSTLVSCLKSLVPQVLQWTASWTSRRSDLLRK